MMKTVVSELVRVKNIKNIIYLAALFALVGCNENNRNTDAGTESLNSDPQSVADTLQSADTDSADIKVTDNRERVGRPEPPHRNEVFRQPRQRHVKCRNRPPRRAIRFDEWTTSVEHHPAEEE